MELTPAPCHLVYVVFKHVLSYDKVSYVKTYNSKTDFIWLQKRGEDDDLSELSVVRFTLHSNPLVLTVSCPVDYIHMEPCFNVTLLLLHQPHAAPRYGHLIHSSIDLSLHPSRRVPSLSKYKTSRLLKNIHYKTMFGHGPFK